MMTDIKKKNESTTEESTTEENTKVYIPVTDYDKVFIGIHDHKSLREFTNVLNEHIIRLVALTNAVSTGFLNESLTEECCIVLVRIALSEATFCSLVMDEIM